MKYLTLNNKDRLFCCFEQKTKFEQLPIVVIDHMGLITKFEQLPIVIIDHMSLITNSVIDKYKIEILDNKINKNIKI